MSLVKGNIVREGRVGVLSRSVKVHGADRSGGAGELRSSAKDRVGS